MSFRVNAWYDAEILRPLFEERQATLRSLGVHPLSCEECRDVLDIYVSDELDGEDVEKTYPALSHHLRRCPLCQDVYADVKWCLAQGLADHPRWTPPASPASDSSPSHDSIESHVGAPESSRHSPNK